MPDPISHTNFSFCTLFQQLGEFEALLLLLIITILLGFKGYRFIVVEYYEIRREVQKGKLSLLPDKNPASATADKAP